MKTKRVLCSLIMIVVCFVLTGCVNVEYQRRVDDEGRILDKITIELDYDKLVEKGYDDTKIMSLLDDIRLDLQQNYVTPISLRLEQIKQHDAILYNKVMAGMTYTPVPTKVVEPELKVYKVSAEVLYQSSEIMSIIYQTQNDESGDGVVTQVEPFLTKYVQTSENVFGDVTTLTINSENFYEAYSADYPEFSDEDVMLTQIYGSTNHRLKSNADTSQLVEDYMCHLWEFSIDEAKTFELEFYYLSPTASSWYILALALAGASVVVLMIIYCIKRKRSKKVDVVEVGETKENE